MTGAYIEVQKGDRGKHKIHLNSGACPGLVIPANPLIVTPHTATAGMMYHGWTRCGNCSAESPGAED